MQVYEFMVPTHYNNGETIDHAAFDAWLANEFGGYTKLPPASGFWKASDGKTYKETVIPYRVACEDENGDYSAKDIAHSVAHEIATRFDQLAVYVGRIGTARIIDYPASRCVGSPYDADNS